MKGAEMLAIYIGALFLGLSFVFATRSAKTEAGQTRLYRLTVVSALWAGCWFLMGSYFK
jgi:hypothetical protein